MPRNESSILPVIIAGDITIDWNIARIRQGSAAGPLTWNAEDTSRACRQRGGAALLADVIGEMAGELEESEGTSREVLHAPVPIEQVCPGDPLFHHSYAMWAPFGASSGGRDVWRVETYLGMDVMPPDADRAHLRLPNEPAGASLYVLDDAALGFRRWSDLWPKGIQENRDAWVLVKTASPVAREIGAPASEGAIWEQLVDVCGDRLIVLMTADDLRLTEVQISRELSWERVGQDLFWEFMHSARVHELSKCAHVIISLGTAGALWLERKPASDSAGAASACALFYDPENFEGQWREKYPGGMIGYTTCLMAAVARQLIRSPKSPDIPLGIQTGVGAMRALHKGGYGQCGDGSARQWPAFPFDTVRRALADEALAPLASCRVPHPRHCSSHARPWTILDDRCALETVPKGSRHVSLEERARDIVKHGLLPTLAGVPVARFGHLATADRREIEGYRSIRGLLSEYCKRNSDRPISIAVFGPPGSGKSFGVKQVAKSIAASVEVLEFNLSQFNGPVEIVDALHQVRDVGLSGKTPLVFWDEFDARLDQADYGWLRYFLAPMQDGSFQDGQITHHIGPAIFVFAGGTRSRMEDFVAAVSTTEMRNTKGPDFVSRLKGHLDVLGPNALDTWFPQGDPHHIIRRAMILRSLFQQWAPHLFTSGDGSGELQIDRGVLRAFLRVSRYRHGVRSMESIIAMSILSGKTRYERSSLPSCTQLDIHVNGLEFVSLVQQPDFSQDMETLAKAVHDEFRKSQKGLPSTSPYADMEYKDLPEDIKEENRASMRDMARKLTATGHVMIPAREGARPLMRFSESDVEIMAEMEHERWIRSKVVQGFRCVESPDREPAPTSGGDASVHPTVQPRDDEAKIHPALRPWHRLSEEQKKLIDPLLLEAMCDGELPESDKEKDRALIRGIPTVLDEAGYVIVKLRMFAEEGDGAGTP